MIFSWEKKTRLQSGFEVTFLSASILMVFLRTSSTKIAISQNERGRTKCFPSNLPHDTYLLYRCRQHPSKFPLRLLSSRKRQLSNTHHLAAKCSPNVFVNTNFVHISVTRRGENTGTAGPRRGTMLVQPSRIGKRESVRPKGIAIDLAKVEADAVVGVIDRVLELQDWLGDLAGRLADLDTAAVVGEGRVLLRVGARMRGDLLLLVASRRRGPVTLSAHVDVHIEIAFVVHDSGAAGACCDLIRHCWEGTRHWDRRGVGRSLLVQRDCRGDAWCCQGWAKEGEQCCEGAGGKFGLHFEIFGKNGYACSRRAKCSVGLECLEGDVDGALNG